VRYAFLAGLLLCSHKPVLLTGESGVGKTAVVQHLLAKLESEGCNNFRNGTVLGSVLNYTDKNQALLDNISSLTRDTPAGVY
jgi:dynein heavy chain